MIESFIFGLVAVAVLVGLVTGFVLVILSALRSIEEEHAESKR